MFVRLCKFKFSGSAFTALVKRLSRSTVFDECYKFRCQLSSIPNRIRRVSSIDHPRIDSPPKLQTQRSATACPSNAVEQRVRSLGCAVAAGCMTGNAHALHRWLLSFHQASGSCNLSCQHVLNMNTWVTLVITTRRLVLGRSKPTTTRSASNTKFNWSRDTSSKSPACPAFFICFQM